jgi:hypothetical protein
MPIHKARLSLGGYSQNSRVLKSFDVSGQDFMQIGEEM